MKDIIKSLLIWLLIIPLAIINGGLRDEIIAPIFGSNIALPLSGLILCSLILLITIFVIPKLIRVTPNTYWLIGIMWFLLTFIFESVFALGMGKTMEEVLSAYDISTGNLWIVVLIFTAIAPWLGAKISKTI